VFFLGPSAASAETAAQLLALAFDHSLPHLQAVALDFVVSNFEVVSKTEAYAALSRDHVALVAAEACRLHSRTKELLTEVSKKAPLADP